MFLKVFMTKVLFVDLSSKQREEDEGSKQRRRDGKRKKGMGRFKGSS